MAACLAIVLVCICMLLNVGSGSAGPVTIKAEPGQNIILPCRAPDKRPALVVRWSRTDLGSDYVLVYRDDQIDPELQHPSYQNRVDLQDRQMKEGNVSLVLNNVTIKDEGTYECRVVSASERSEKLISTTYLSVAPPPAPGDKEGQEDHGKDQVGDSSGVPVSIVLAVLAVIVVAVIIAAVYFGMKKKNSYRQQPSGD